MSDTGRGEAGAGRVTLDQLIALNDEILALTRAGMPLERGLLTSSGDLPGRLKKLSEAVGERMTRGESLPEALGSLGDGVPPVYRAVVEAGARSGDLASALEGLATYARGYDEARRSIGLALAYPLVVMTLAYGLFVLLLQFVLPKFEAVMYDLGIPVHPAWAAFGWLGARVWLWGPILPVCLVLFLAAWVGSGRAMGLHRGRSFGLLRWFPWVGAMLRGYEASGFADLMALLLEHGVPYPEALRLAGEASGDDALAGASRGIAAAVERGDPPADALRSAGAFPPLLRWVLSSGSRQGNLVEGLRQMATRYRSDARDQAEKIRVLLPTILLFGLGGTATLVYAFALFYPVSTLWSGLALPLK